MPALGRAGSLTVSFACERLAKVDTVMLALASSIIKNSPLFD